MGKLTHGAERDWQHSVLFDMRCGSCLRSEQHGIKDHVRQVVDCEFMRRDQTGERSKPGV
jgi:prophage tail gpP-like protein